MHLQEVVLGDLIFDMVNELQINKFHLGWKLNSNGFPKSYHTLNLDTGKASKILPQNALCSARRIEPQGWKTTIHHPNSYQTTSFVCK